MSDLSAQYSPKNIEHKWYQSWEQAQLFKPSNQHDQEYCIVIPPPNVTGSLHMGHGFQHTLMDILTRYKRMSGFNTLWQPGTDHAGIATQMVVEKQLLEQNISKYDLGKEKFIEKIWEWKQQSGDQISKQTKRLGSSLDWSRDKFTLDEGMSKTVKQVFISLYREQLIYRGKKLVNWDPVLKTAISDLEVTNTEERGKIWEIKYPIQDTDTHIIIATTRPETIFADVAIAVHPDDNRYQHLIGKQATIPIINKLIPIIADDSVEQDFGTGCVKITPAHDFNDYAIGLRHDLDMINILSEDATLNDQVPTEYQNLDCINARKKIIQHLQQLNLLQSEQNHNKMVPRGDRSGAIIEPYLTNQWFIDIKTLAQPAIDAVKNGDIKFVPQNWENTYFQWMNNIQDWCISRQLWWGHQIPAWYDQDGKVYVGEDEQHIRDFYQLPADTVLTPDNDVLDTWFSSALWPFATLGWPDDTDNQLQFFPTDVLVTGFDIIFFWVARMIMFSLKFTNKIPFKQIYITGLIKDGHGQKMSKSKGNILDPIDLIDGITLEQLLKKRTANLMQPEMADKITAQTIKEFPNGITAHGTDALRFTFCALASTGRDIKFDMERLLGYRNFCNKLWNAARFSLMQCTHPNYYQQPNPEALSLADHWINNKLQITINKSHEYLEKFRFDLLAQLLHEFVWSDFCAWYLEVAKKSLKDNNNHDQKYAISYTLTHTLTAILKILHPIIPFITEELWSYIQPKIQDNTTSIMQTEFPKINKKIDNEIISDFAWFQGLIETIRNTRAEYNIPNKKPLTLVINNIEQEPILVTKYKDLIMNIGNINQLLINEKTQINNSSITCIYSNLEMLIPITNLIDPRQEFNRLNKVLTKAEAEHEKLYDKILDPDFANKAPAKVIVQEEIKLSALSDTIKKYKAKIDELIK